MFFAYTEDELKVKIYNLRKMGMVDLEKISPGLPYTGYVITHKGSKYLENADKFDNGNSLSDDFELNDDDNKILNGMSFFFDRFNDRQKKSIISNDKYVLCIAGAGSGKTTVLINKIVYNVKFKGMAQDKILAITFTKKARDEMKERLESLIPTNRIRVETFNSYAERFLRKYEKEYFGYSKRMISNKERFALFKEAIGGLDYRFSDLIELYFSKRQRSEKTKEQLMIKFMFDMFSIINHFKLEGKGFPDKEEFLKIGKRQTIYKLVWDVCNYLLKKMEDLGFRDFSDQLADTLKIMEMYQKIKSFEFMDHDGEKCFWDEKNNKFYSIIDEYDLVLVDEYQDVNDVQFEFLKNLKTRLFCVGDPRQSIYGWRGARISHIMDFKLDYPECKVFYLLKNYRSSKNIVDVSNKSIEFMKLPDLESFRDNEKKPILISHDSRDAEIRFLLSTIKHVKENIFILSRTNADIKELSEVLKREQIKHSIKLDEEKSIIDNTTSILLSTVHGIKGMEADNVYVMNASSSSFPCKGSSSDVISSVASYDYESYEEEKRLFYVALTRAKKNLVVSYYGKSHTSFITDKMLHDFNIIGKDIEKVKEENLTRRLKDWRTLVAGMMPAYYVLSDSVINEIVSVMPSNMLELGQVSGIGKAKLEKYGKDILRILDSV
jgi:superfamily I DNA/RNA helicase